MTIDVKKIADQVTITVAGRLDTTTAPALEKAINENVQEEKHLVLDIKELEYLSSAGLRVLLGAQKKMQKIGSMKVKNVCEEVMEVFEMTGFADILVIDCEKLVYISSAGLRVLLTAQKKAKDSMKLINVCELVMEVFEMTGFADILVIE